MKFKHRNTKYGLIVAPLAGPLTLFIIVMVTNNLLLMNFRDFISSLILFMVIGALFSYGVAIFLGLPIYYLIKRIDLINFWTMSLGSASIALIATYVLTEFFGFNQATQGNNPMNTYLAMLVSGYVVGIVFWFTSGESHA